MKIARAVSTESLKERISALYMNMDVPEISPSESGGGIGGSGVGGLLNVSLSIGSVLKFSDHVLDVSFTLSLRWRHKFLEMLKDDLVEAVPLNRQKLWTPQFVFLNVLTVTEDQSSLYLHLPSSELQDRAVVYRLWHRASVRCDGPSIQHPFGHHICSLMFEETHPEHQRSLRMSLGLEHRTNCSRAEDGRHSAVYRVSKHFSSDSGRFQFRTQICLRSSAEEMTPVLRQYCLSFLMVLLALSTVFCFDRGTRLFVNLAVLHILALAWSPRSVPRLNAADVWQAGGCLVVSCCLVAALAAGGRRKGAAAAAAVEVGSGRSGDYCKTRGVRGCNGHHAAIAYQKDSRSAKCAVTSAVVLSDSSDHLDLFGGCGIIDGGSGGGAGGSGGGVDGRRSGRCCRCRRLFRAALPLAWATFAAVFWSVVLLTAPRCETLLPECFK